MDRYGRTISQCFVGQTDINGWLVEQGLALAYRRYSRDYVTAENEARAAGRGRSSPRGSGDAGSDSEGASQGREGDSMMPTLHHGDIVLVDLARRAPPGIFVLHDGMGLVAKRLDHIPNTDPPLVAREI